MLSSSDLEHPESPAFISPATESIFPDQKVLSIQTSIHIMDTPKPSQSTSKSATTPSNPSNLPPRYEIRRLTVEDHEWVMAIFGHSNTFHSNVFPKVYPENKGARFNFFMRSGNYLVEHQLVSGMSFGVFDLEYRYKRPESAATGGKFWYDNSNDDVTGDELLEQMDFPLVSIALSYDAYNKLDSDKMAPMLDAVPIYNDIFGTLNALDTRDESSWQAKGPREVLMRNATSTRHDYEGQKTMGALARFLMREAKSLGYRAINIEALNDAVTHVWSNPPAPFKGTIVAEFNTWEYEKTDENGEKVNPLYPARQRVTKVYTELL